MSRLPARAIVGLGIACFALAVSACGGGGAGSATAPQQASNGANVSGLATLTIADPVSPAGVRRTNYVSSSAASVAITINGGTAVDANVSATSTLCSANATGRTCSIPIAAPVGADTFAVSAYDGANGSGNLLGSGAGTQTVVFGTPFTVNVTIDPVVAAASSPIVTYATGTAFVSGIAGTATLTLALADPDGNPIPATAIAVFTPALTVTSSDPNVTVTPASWSGTPAAIAISYNGSTAAASSVTITISAGSKTLATAPVTIAPQSGSTVGSLCSAVSSTPSETVPGVYTDIFEDGTFVTSFTPTGGTWDAYAVTAASPAPSSTPFPVTSPSPQPSVSPTATPTPVTYDIWTGTYTVAGYTTTTAFTASPAPTAVNPTSGCMYVVATVGGTSPNADVVGFPTFATYPNFDVVNQGMVTAFSFTPPLTASAGPFTGSFTLDNGATGTATISGFQTFTSAKARALLERIRNRHPF